MEKMPKVSIILLNWNNYWDTKECLESLGKITYPNYEIVVVDNGSVDGSTKNIQKEFPQHIYLYNNDNLGFAGGTNVGIKYAIAKGADYIFFINNDMIVDEEFLEPLVNAAENRGVGLVGPATYCYPEKEKLYTAGRSANFLKGGIKENKLPESTREVECLGGSFLIKKDVIEKIGYFYEPYFLNFEEVDYCFQTRKAGFKIICEPKSKIWHKIRKTLDKMPALSAYYFYRNKFLFVKRNAPFYIKYPFYFYGSLFLLFKFLENLLVKKEKKMAFAIRESLIDFWKGNFGKRSGF